MSRFGFVLGAAEPAFEARLAALESARFPARLWSRDAALWGDAPERVRVASNRLGWLEVARRMQGEVGALEAFADEVARDGYTTAVLLGMGGSSLAPEVMRRTYGVRPGRLDLTVLDNTSPAAVEAVHRAHDPKTTLFLVSSKSGSTIEVSCFERSFREAVAKARPDPGRSFVAITDPGSPLETSAREHGYRRVFLNPADIGGRYSALSYFGLVPAALIGADLGALLASAARHADASGPQVPAGENAPVALGAALGELARAGRDKLTLVLGEEIAALGSWIEQLVAESSGKDGRGIVPVVDEALGAPESYGADRVFVAISARPLSSAVDARLTALRDAGHPVLRWTLRDLSELGGEFLGWEIATAVACATIDVDPFDEPNVTEAKNATRAALDRWLERGRFELPAPIAAAGEVEARVSDALARALEPDVPADPWSALAATAAQSRAGDYLALLAYLHPTEGIRSRLERLRHALRERTRCATTLGIGPRYLHSTGQLHKGGPDEGLFVMLTASEGDRPIPGERWGFGTLQAAQALGDAQALETRGRRVLRLHLGAAPEPALDRLIEAVAARARA